MNKKIKKLSKFYYALNWSFFKAEKNKTQHKNNKKYIFRV